MDNSKLQEFVTITVLRNRITFGDARRLQRDYLPGGITSREEAAVLIQLDAMVALADKAWTDWLIAAVFDFAVFSERTVDAETGSLAWLRGYLAAFGTATKVTKQLSRDIHQLGEPMEPVEPVEVDEPAAPAELAEIDEPVQLTIPFPALGYRPARPPAFVTAVGRPANRPELVAA
jgi:hypothetical protein